MFVSLFQGSTYEVIEDGESLFMGSLSDCDAWISLVEKGYINRPSMHEEE